MQKATTVIDAFNNLLSANLLFFYYLRVQLLWLMGLPANVACQQCCHAEQSEASVKADPQKAASRFPIESYETDIPADIPVSEIPLSEVLPHFDWRMFYAIWGVKYGSAVPEAMELMQLRRDAEDELAVADFKIMLSAKFFSANATRADEICFTADGKTHKWPMMRQEGDKALSLCDYIVPDSSGKKSAFGMFAICVHKRSKAHEEGCSCPACSNQYEDMIGKAVRVTLAEAAAKWVDSLLADQEKKIKIHLRHLKQIYRKCH